jgi:hypothetical protein
MKHREEFAMWFWILLVVLILLMAGSAPAWPYSRDWGYAPTGGAGLLVAILLILLLVGIVEVPGCAVHTEVTPPAVP